MVACPPSQDETSATPQGVGLRRRQSATPRTPRKAVGDGPHMAASAAPCDHETADAMPVQLKRPSNPRGAGAPFRSTSRGARRVRVGRSRNETIRPRDGAHSRTLQPRPPNRETRGDRPTPPTIPPPTTHHPEHTAERGNHDSQTSPEENNTRIDDEPLHNEAHRAAADATTTRDPALGAHATRIVERPRKRNTIAETHSQSNLSSWAG